jgi:hypothetical protein
VKNIVVSKQVKLEILTICSGPTSRPENLPNEIVLAVLGYDEYEEWCRLLETRLQYIASQYNTGKQIPLGHITAATTVSECIQMVI